MGEAFHCDLDLLSQLAAENSFQPRYRSYNQYLDYLITYRPIHGQAAPDNADTS